MSLIFEEYVRVGVREALRFEIVDPDGIEFIAVGAAILQLAADRLYRDFDFPENWRKDPKAYGIYIQLVTHIFLAWAPNREEACKTVINTLHDIASGKSYERPEPTTNRDIEYRRRLASLRRCMPETPSYNPKRDGKVRDYSEAELAEYLFHAEERAGNAYKQWRAGVSLAAIEA
jgi:hypothetical protein